MEEETLIIEAQRLVALCELGSAFYMMAREPVDEDLVPHGHGVQKRAVAVEDGAVDVHAVSFLASSVRYNDRTDML